MHQCQVRATDDDAVQQSYDLDLAQRIGDDREAMSGANLRTKRLVGSQHAAAWRPHPAMGAEN
jgi:hypothetical protein